MIKIKLNKKLLSLIMITIIAIAIIIMGIILLNRTNIKNLDEKLLAETTEDNEPITYEVYANNINENIQIFIKVNSDKGINTINCPNGNTIDANGKNDIAIDYEIEKDKEYIFEAKLNDESISRKVIKVGDKDLEEIININVTPEDKLQANLDIAYNTADILTNKQYRIGNAKNFINYTNELKINSQEILDNNLGVNEDKTVTIYAKALNDEGVGIELEKKVTCLDFDNANKPILDPIETTSEYATIFSYGVGLMCKAQVTFDSRTDTNDFYSTDNGNTWQQATEKTLIISDTIIIKTKSVKKESGLTTYGDNFVATGNPTAKNAIGVNAYDGNDSTGVNSTAAKRI